MRFLWVSLLGGGGGAGVCSATLDEFTGEVCVVMLGKCGQQPRAGWRVKILDALDCSVAWSAALEILHVFLNGEVLPWT